MTTLIVTPQKITNRKEGEFTTASKTSTKKVSDGGTPLLRRAAPSLECSTTVPGNTYVSYNHNIEVDTHENRKKQRRKLREKELEAKGKALSDSGRRLVEYFIVVSVKPKIIRDNKIHKIEKYNSEDIIPMKDENNRGKFPYFREKVEENGKPYPYSNLIIKNGENDNRLNYNIKSDDTTVVLNNQICRDKHENNIFRDKTQSNKHNNTSISNSCHKVNSAKTICSISLSTSSSPKNNLSDILHIAENTSSTNNYPYVETAQNSCFKGSTNTHQPVPSGYNHPPKEKCSRTSSLLHKRLNTHSVYLYSSPVFSSETATILCDRKFGVVNSSALSSLVSYSSTTINHSSSRVKNIDNPTNMKNYLTRSFSDHTFENMGTNTRSSTKAHSETRVECQINSLRERLSSRAQRFHSNPLKHFQQRAPVVFSEIDHPIVTSDHHFRTCVLLDDDIIKMNGINYCVSSSEKQDFSIEAKMRLIVSPLSSTLTDKKYEVKDDYSQDKNKSPVQYSQARKTGMSCSENIADSLIMTPSKMRAMQVLENGDGYDHLLANNVIPRRNDRERVCSSNMVKSMKDIDNVVSSKKETIKIVDSDDNILLSNLTHISYLQKNNKTMEEGFPSNFDNSLNPIFDGRSSILAATSTSSIPSPSTPPYTQKPGASINIRIPNMDETHEQERDLDKRDYKYNARINRNIFVHETSTNMKHSSSRRKTQFFQPVVTARYPIHDREDNPLNPMVMHFCYPQSDVIEPTGEYCMPKIHHFVLTNDRGKKMYGTCLTVYEELDDDEYINDSDVDKNLGITPASSPAKVQEYQHDGMGVEVSWYTPTTSPINPTKEVPCPILKSKVMRYVPKVLCLLSTWPYLHAFREYVSQLYRLTTMTVGLMDAPLERYILNVCEEVPAPPPGSFELRLSIFNSTLRFWAPPANQPIAYVALPFGTLFECLDMHNLVLVWYALSLERKVLLLSSHYGLITLCAEILCSLLFPMRWSHLYIPVLPRFLSPMLDAPMPYLCGIGRDNFTCAIEHISDETIIVDLDQNVITMGSGTPELPSMPLKRRIKLEHALEKNVGDVFWNARGMNREQVKRLEEMKVMLPKQSKKLIEVGNNVWKEKLGAYDDAFNLAYTPDSPSLLNGDDMTSSVMGNSGMRSLYTSSVSDCADYQQSQWDAVQEAFLRFYVSLLKDYRQFLSTTSAETDDEFSTLTSPLSTQRWSSNRTFLRDEFLSSQRSDVLPFLREFVMTQQFDDFLTKRLYSPDEPDVIFFDQNITAKLNRSKMTLKKKNTPFLQSAKAHKVLNIIEAVKPSNEGLPNDDDDEIKEGHRYEPSFNLLGKLYGSSSNCPKSTPKRTYTYASWPETFDRTLFGSPRPIPAIITAEYDRRAALALRLSANYDEDDFDDFQTGDCHPNPEVATFTVFYIMYGALVGQELAALHKRRIDAVQFLEGPNGENRGLPKSEGEDLLSNNEPQDFNTRMNDESFLNCGLVPDCSIDICSSCDWSSNPTDFIWGIRNGTQDGNKNSASKETKHQIINGNDATTNLLINSTHSVCFNDSITSTELEEAKILADAYLDLAFSTLNMMIRRKLSADPDAYKALMEACGRCGNTQRATELIVLLRQDGLLVDSEIYSAYLSAYSVSKMMKPEEPRESPLAHIQPTIIHHHSHLSAGQHASRNDIDDTAFFCESEKSSKSIQAFIRHSCSNNSVELGSLEHISESGSCITSSLGVSTAETSSQSSFRKDGKWNPKNWSLENHRRTSSLSILSRKRSKIKLRKKESLFTTEQVAKHIIIGDSLLEYLYADLVIDTSSDACPKCSRNLSEDEVIMGWESCSFKDYTTKCYQCQHRFVPRFVVKTSSPSFMGSQGRYTPLYCEFLSPWVLRKELHAATRGQNGMNIILDPEWRSGTDINATLWWNMIVSFKRYKLPVTFMLQGSFRNRLIMPM